MQCKKMMAPCTCSDMLLLFFIKVFFTCIIQMEQQSSKITLLIIKKNFQEHTLNSMIFPVFPGVAYFLKYQQWTKVNILRKNHKNYCVHRMTAPDHSLGVTSQLMCHQCRYLWYLAKPAPAPSTSKDHTS